MSNLRLLPPAPPALLVHGPWRAPVQEFLRPRAAFDEVRLAPALAGEVAATSKKNARQASAARRAVQLDWTVEPYTLSEWLRLPALRDPKLDDRDDAPLVERRRVRKLTLPARTSLTADERMEQSRIRFERTPVRPVVRGECGDVPRPCPFVSCRHHLYLEVNPETGSITLNFPGLDPWEMASSCSLDVADQVDPDEPLDTIPIGHLLNRRASRVHGLVVDAEDEFAAKVLAFREGDDGQ